MTLRQVLVANRGEIAVRVVRACADEGLRSVVAVSEADRESRAALVADRAVCIGPASATDSYLDIGRVVAAALGTGCDAVHPGYGFLAERPELAEACAEHGLVFVGPPADAIRRGGDKAVARELAESLGIPVGEGSDTLADAVQARAVADGIGYPVVLKAAAGGGGRGMVRVDSGEQLSEAFGRATHEAQQAFGDGRMYLERFITRARHVEVQVLADHHGGIVHLGERDCSTQRRYQKLIEEAPARAVPEEIRRDLCAAAVELCRALDYVGAGTVEFVVDVDRGIWSFLEVNTRVQVEHPVTEMVTGIDIVRAQLAIAGGDRLPVRQSDVVLRGHAVEVRVNAEDPRQDFAPVPGLVSRWVEPVGGGLRIDTHVFGGYRIPPHYDSLLAKVIAHGPDREAALDRLDRGLAHLVIEGVPTTAELLRAVLGAEEFRAERHHTRWIEQEFLPEWRGAPAA
ncbi:acetyl-CoA carboxylase biotin carboxylase subunit [Blastococcus jejuensis]|uniref:biotin carboxylase n=1 Tax=Blastococcus jejuensis TaxID=351224 RepID=A0ABP6P2F2_9ACTN